MEKQNMNQMVRNVNLANKDFLEMYGGKDFMKDQLPELFSAFCRKSRATTYRSARKGAVAKNGVPAGDGALVRNGTPARNEDLDNDVSIQEVSLRDGVLSVQGVTSISDDALFIDERMVIKNQQGEILKEVKRSTPDATHKTLTLDAPVAENQERLTAEYTAIWGDADGNLKSSVCVRNIVCNTVISGSVKKIDIIDPKKRNGDTQMKAEEQKQQEEQDIPIYICYNRHIAEKADYEFASTLVNNRQKLILPFGAKVWLADPSDSFERIDISTFRLKIDCQNGTAKYTMEKRDIPIEKRFEKTDYGFQFTLDSDWRDIVPSKRWPIRERVDIFFEVEFLHKSGRRSSVRIGSSLDGSVPNNKKIPWLNLLWGCLAKGTRIKMADGTVKKIEEIVPGDRIQLRTGQAVISDVITGTEQFYLCVQTENHVIRVSKDHPFLTTEGVVAAKDLNGSHYLAGEHGEEKITGIWECEGGPVYNLALDDNGDGDAYMLADGLWVGDFRMQCEQRKSSDKEARDNPYRKECEIKNKLWAGEQL